LSWPEGGIRVHKQNNLLWNEPENGPQTKFKPALKEFLVTHTLFTTGEFRNFK